jgi:hypothetical protein
VEAAATNKHTQHVVQNSETTIASKMDLYPGAGFHFVRSQKPLQLMSGVEDEMEIKYRALQNYLKAVWVSYTEPHENVFKPNKAPLFLSS